MPAAVAVVAAPATGDVPWPWPDRALLQRKITSGVDLVELKSVAQGDQSNLAHFIWLICWKETQYNDEILAK